MRARKAEEAFVERMRGRTDRTTTPPPPNKPLHSNPHSQSHPQLEGYSSRRPAGVGGAVRTPSVQNRRLPKADTGAAAQSPPTLWSASAKSPRLDDYPAHTVEDPGASASATQQQYEESMEDAAQELNDTASSREHCSRLDSLAHLRLAVTRITVEELRELSEEVDETVDEAGNRFKCRPDYDLQVKVVALICAMALANEPVSVADVLEDDLPLTAWIAAQRALHKPSELLKALRAFPPQIVRWNRDAPWPGPALQAARVFLAQGADEVGDCVLSHLQLWIQAAVLHFDPSMTTYVDELPEPEGLGEAPDQGKETICHEESEVVEHFGLSSTPAVTASLFANTKQQGPLGLDRVEPLDVEPSLVDDSAESTHEVVAALLRAADTAARSEACVDIGCPQAGRKESPAVASTSTSPLFGDVSSREVGWESNECPAVAGTQKGSSPRASPSPDVRPCFQELLQKRVSEVLGNKSIEHDGAEMARRENRKPDNDSPTPLYTSQVISKPASLFGQDLTAATPGSTAVGTVKDTSPPSPPLPEQPAHAAESEDSSEQLPSPPHLKTSIMAPDTTRSQLSSVSDGPIEHQADWTANSVTFSRDLNTIQRWIRRPQEENLQPGNQNNPAPTLAPTPPPKEEALKARTGGENLRLSPLVQPTPLAAATETRSTDTTTSSSLRSKALEPPPTWHWKALREVNQILSSDSGAGAKGKENCPPAPQHQHIKDEKKEEDAGQITATAGPKPLQAALRATPTPVRSGGSSASGLPSPVQRPAPLAAKLTPPPPPPPSAVSTAPTPQRRPEAVAAPEAREPSRKPEIAVPDVREAARKWELQPSQVRGRSSPTVQLKFDDSADLDLLCQELLQKPAAAAPAPATAPAACRAPSAGRRFIPSADTSNPWQADAERSFAATRASSVTPPSRSYLNVSPVYPASSSSFKQWPAPPASLRASSETCTSSIGGGLFPSSSGRLDRSIDRNPCRTPRQGMTEISRSRNPFQSTSTPTVPRAVSQQDISDIGLAERFQILAAAARTPIHQPILQQQPPHQPFLLRQQTLKQPLQQTQPQPQQQQQQQWGEREQRLAPPTPQRLQQRQQPPWEPQRLQPTPHRQREQQEEQNHHRQPLVPRPVLAPPVPRSPADPFAKEDARGGMERLLHGVSRLQQRRMSTPNEPVSRLARGNGPVGAGDTITASSSTSLAWRRSTPSTPQVLSPEEAEIAAADPSPLLVPRLASATTPGRSRAWEWPTTTASSQQQQPQQQQPLRWEPQHIRTPAASVERVREDSQNRFDPPAAARSQSRQLNDLRLLMTPRRSPCEAPAVASQQQQQPQQQQKQQQQRQELREQRQEHQQQQQQQQQQQAFPSAVEEAAFYDVDDEKYLRRRAGGSREAGAGAMQAPAADEASASDAVPAGPTPWRVSRPPPTTSSSSATLSSCNMHDADHRRRYEIGILIAYVIVLLIGIWCMLKLAGDIALWVGPAPKDYTKRPGAHGNPKLQGYL